MDEELRAITDGKLYSLNDMVKVGCHDCAGCSECCRDMGESILVDPHDAFILVQNLGKSFEELLNGPLELHVEDGVILPNLRMIDEANPHCSFLNQEGRCSIHDIRPGICRLFPLGRNYEDGQLSYFLLTDACPIGNKSKMKVSKWIAMPDLKAYQKFLVDWHSLTKSLKFRFQEDDLDDAAQKQMNLLLLQQFYMRSWNDFYPEFYEKLERVKSVFGF